MWGDVKFFVPLPGSLFTILLFVCQIRNALNVAALAAFLAYVGAGLAGTAGLGDYNLALDDSYQGQVVKGCPTYEEVRQPSMVNFDIQKYEGKWYEHKFHDWTQFKEVYDTTLDIKVRTKRHTFESLLGCRPILVLMFLCSLNS